MYQLNPNNIAQYIIMETCSFLDRLPVELRLRIYELLLSFSRPIKLRQFVPGSRNLAVLRVCQQVRDEVWRSPPLYIAWILKCVIDSSHLCRPLVCCGRAGTDSSELYTELTRNRQLHRSSRIVAKRLSIGSTHPIRSKNDNNHSQ